MNSRVSVLCFSVALTFIWNLQESSAQIINRRFSHRSNCIMLKGLPAHDYSTRAPSISRTIVGYASPTLPTLSVNSSDSANSSSATQPIDLLFRFPGGPLKLETGIGTIYLSNIGAQIRNETQSDSTDVLPSVRVTAQIHNDGGNDSLLKSPKVRISVDLLATLSSEVKPTPDARILWNGSKEFRANRITESIDLITTTADSSPNGSANSLGVHLNEITHVRIQMTYLPNR